MAVQLVDWGLAHQHEIAPDGAVLPARLRSRCGSRSYMAPEVATLKAARGGREARGGRGGTSGGATAAPGAAAAVSPATLPVVGESGEAGVGIPRERGYDGFAADVWSVGVCLFAMRAGWSEDATPRLGRGLGLGCCASSGRVPGGSERRDTAKRRDERALGAQPPLTLTYLLATTTSPYQCYSPLQAARLLPLR